LFLRSLLFVTGLVFRCLPRRVANAVGAFLGLVWYHVIPVRRKVARENLKTAFPNETRSERARIARGCYVHLARSAVEFLRLGGLTRKKAEKFIEETGWENYESAMKQGHGVIVVTAHFGNFDLLACVQALRGVPLHIVTREQHVTGINSYWMRQRARFGLGLIPARNSALKIHRLLKDGQVVALVIDQHMPPGRGVAVPFFGRPASTTHAPALLALTTGAPILPVTIERLAGGRHRIEIDEPLPVDHDADRAAVALRVTTELNRWLERRIEKRPEQWLWIHRRFKI